jgi:hypothetical protein
LISRFDLVEQFNGHTEQSGTDVIPGILGDRPGVHPYQWFLNPDAHILGFAEIEGELC